MRAYAVTIAISVLLGASGCGFTTPMASRLGNEVVPAVEFSRAMKTGKSEDFSIFNVSNKTYFQGQQPQPAVMMVNAQGMPVQQFNGDPRYLQQGFKLERSVGEPPAPQNYAMMAGSGVMPVITDAARVMPPPGSSAPYYNGQMTANPSLWPDEAEANSLFRDIRAYQPMDIVTVILNEKAEGAKKAETDSENKFSILAAIKSFFGEEQKWISNNAGLDPESLISAETNSKYEGKGETKRAGTLRAKISAVVLEVLPNGLLRVEGSKIVSVDHEEEIMVISGLARTKDIDSANQIDSARIANMRVDFYGRGVVAESTFPGWAARVLRYVWPF